MNGVKTGRWTRAAFGVTALIAVIAVVCLSTARFDPAFDASSAAATGEIADGNRDAFFFVQATKRPLETVPSEDAITSDLDDLELEKVDVKESERPPMREMAPLIEGETFEFKAEMADLLEMVIHNLYKHKDIAIRELISNASDALTKLRYALLKAGNVVDENGLRIEIKADKAEKTLTFRDYGIGMSKAELINNLGTLAKSGTKEFMRNLMKSSGSGNNNDTSDLIGQFGLGFYSSYLLADKVTVRSKQSPNATVSIWESLANKSFVVAQKKSDAMAGQGTEITLFLKTNAHSFLEETALTEHIRYHSGFIDFPILLWTERTEKEEVPLTKEELAAEAKKRKAASKKTSKKKDADADDDDADAEDDDDEDVEEVDEESDKALPKTKSVDKVVEEWKRVSQKAIWRRDPREVTEEAYRSFYHELIEAWKLKSTHTKAPLAHSHFRSEGQLQFSSLLYIPGENGNNAMQAMQATLQNVKLYIKRVFITENFDDMFPRWLSFVKGVVDSDDLPLNINREQLQQTKMLRSIKRKMVSKSLEMIKDLSKNETHYADFLKVFGQNLKLGVLEDEANKPKIIKMLRFHSSQSGGQMNVSLDAYVERMKKKQSGLFFLSGGSLEEIEQSVFLEKPLARGYEVLYLPDPIDEYMMQAVTEYEGKPFKNIAKEGIRYGDEDKDEKKQMKATKKKMAPLTSWMGDILSDVVEKVELSVQLVRSPAAIKAKSFGRAGNMEKIMKSQALSGEAGFMDDFFAKQKKIMEINPDHPLIQKMLKVVEEEGEEAATSRMRETARVLYDASLISSGYSVADVSGFQSRLEKIMRKALDVSEEAVANVTVRKAEDRVDGEEDDEEETASGSSTDDDDEEDEDDDGAKKKAKTSVFSDKTMPDMADMSDLPDLPDFSASPADEEKKEASDAAADDDEDDEKLDHDEL